MDSDQKMWVILGMIKEACKISPKGNLSQIGAKEIDEFMSR